MPIRFICPHCDQLLSVARRKVGQPVTCPKCAGAVLVPPPLAEEATPSPPGSPAKPVSADVSTGTDDQAGSPGSEAARASASVGRDRGVTFSRSALYFIGGLLVVVAILAFLLGMSFGRFSANSQLTENSSGPCQVTGRLIYKTSAGSLVGDAESVIVIVPVGRQPDEKLQAAPLRPEAPPPAPEHSTLVGIRSLGGAYARAQPNGAFSVEVQGAGEYFVLFLSNHVRRGEEREPAPLQIAQIARYFVPADELLGANAYRWSRERIRGDTSLDHSFAGP